LKPRFGGWLLPEVWQRRSRNKRKVKQTNKQLATLHRQRQNPNQNFKHFNMKNVTQQQWKNKRRTGTFGK